MRKFLIVVNILLFIALAVSVGVFWYVHYLLNTKQPTDVYSPAEKDEVLEFELKPGEAVGL